MSAVPLEAFVYRNPFVINIKRFNHRNLLFFVAFFSAYLDLVPILGKLARLVPQSCRESFCVEFLKGVESLDSLRFTLNFEKWGAACALLLRGQDGWVDVGIAKKVKKR